jgi:DNA-directed RNA polymerase subunit M/transcription elongation factor TFIIS
MQFIDQRRARFLERFGTAEASELEWAVFRRAFAVGALTRAGVRRDHNANIAFAQTVLQFISHSRWVRYREEMLSFLLEYKQNPRLFELYTVQELLDNKHIVAPKMETEAMLSNVMLVPLVRYGLFRCVECNSRHTDNHSVQIRAADEPATVFVHCFDCGADWIAN